MIEELSEKTLQVFDKWERSGLLENLERQDRIIISQLMESAESTAQELFSNWETNLSEEEEKKIYIYLFPCIRRIYERYKLKFNVEIMFFMLLNFVKHHKKDFENPKSRYGDHYVGKYDSDASMLIFFCNHYYDIDINGKILILEFN